MSQPPSSPLSVRPETIALVLVLGIFGVLLVGKLLFDQKPRYDAGLIELAEGNVRKALHLSVVAHQDSSPAIALIHISQALSLVETVEALLGDGEASRVSGVHVPGLLATLNRQQADILSACAQRYPELVPRNGHLAWDHEGASTSSSSSSPAVGTDADGFSG